MESPPRHGTASPRFTEDFSSSPISPPYSQPPVYVQDYHPYSQNSPRSPYHEDGGMQHRLSNKDRPLSPTISSSLPESIMADEGDKEVAYPQAIPLPYVAPNRDEAKGANARRVLGIRSRWFYALLIGFIVIAIGLGVGLGVGLGTRDSGSATPSSSQSGASSTTSPSTPTSTANANSVGGGINPAYYTKNGAFNYSGIALASQSFTEDLQDASFGNLVMYFQHHSGEIRWERLSDWGEWVGGSSSEVVASDAKNSTPLSAVAYVRDSVSTWHIFYVDQDNHLRERFSSNISGMFWFDGPLNEMNLTVLDSDQVGMQACWYGNAYGDADYVHTFRPSSGSSGTSSEVGMHLWYASNETTFKQYGWCAGGEEWQYQQDWTDLNGHAGVGCYSWAEGTVTYVMFVDLENTVNFYWKDTNTNTAGNDSHPINEWTNSPISIPDVNPATSLGYTNFFYAQMADNSIKGYNISWGAENTTFVEDDTFVVDGEPGLSGTHFSVTALPNQSGGNSLQVFYQSKGDDITLQTRDIEGGPWTNANIEIPDP